MPAGNEPTAQEPGCRDPVNNASPARVQRIAALAVEAMIKELRGLDGIEELFEVYESIEAPFDQIGRSGVPGHEPGALEGLALRGG